MKVVAVLSKYRPGVDEYEKIVNHAVEGARTLCGLDLRRIKVWEPTAYEVNCKRCVQGVNRRTNE